MSVLNLSMNIGSLNIEVNVDRKSKLTYNLNRKIKQANRVNDALKKREELISKHYIY